MKVVLADIEAPALAHAEQSLKATGAEVLSVQTDVSKAGDVEKLAQKTLETFGAAHLLFNNAGVGAGTTVWESSLADWEWVIGVNLMGIVHGLHTFVPIMLKEDTECHIVNTASIAGLIYGPGLGIYKATKHAVVSISETLACELAAAHAKIGVSVLCPEWVKTRIMESERNRPAQMQNPVEAPTPEAMAMYQFMVQAVQSGMSPQEVADKVFEAIRTDRFYILTHPETLPLVQARMENILQGKNPA
jgi:NAD(P)-dependent dehydrogenase (short-subunit alcohol dehydrogenase family)